MLFLNASSYKLGSVGTWKDAFYNQTESTALIVNWCLWFSLFRLFSINNDKPLDADLRIVLLATPFVVHLGINFIFSNDLKIIKADYKQYYQNYWYLTYCIFAVLSVIFTLYYLFCLW